MNPIAELAMPIGILTKEVKTDIEKHSITPEAKKVSAQTNLKPYKDFRTFSN